MWTIEWHWLQFPLDVKPVESWKSGRRWVVIHLGPLRLTRELIPRSLPLSVLEDRAERRKRFGG